MTSTSAVALKKQENNVLRLTWPIFVELLLQMLVGNADQIMVGWWTPTAWALSATPTR